MTNKTEAIVLNKVKYNDSSIIVNLYTYEIGRVAAIVYLNKSSKSGIKPALFSPLNIIETEVKIKDKRNIQNIVNCNNLLNPSNISADIAKTSIALFISEILIKTIREEEPNKELFEFIKKTAITLNDATQNVFDIHLFFLKDFAKFSGFEISHNYCPATPYFNLKDGMFLPLFTCMEESLDAEESYYMSGLLQSEYNGSKKLFNYKIRTNLINRMIQYYRFHIDRFGDLNSLKILQEVFND